TLVYPGRIISGVSTANSARAESPPERPMALSFRFASVGSAAAPDGSREGATLVPVGEFTAADQFDNALHLSDLFARGWGLQYVDNSDLHQVVGVGETELAGVEARLAGRHHHDRPYQVVGQNRRQQLLFHHLHRLHRDPLQSRRLLQTAQVAFHVPPLAI